MALNFGTLSQYTDASGQDLVAKLVARSGQIASVANIIDDVRFAAAIPTHSTTLYLQAGNCGWTPTGTTNVGQITVSVSPLSYLEAMCVQTANQYLTKFKIKQGASDGDDVNFAEMFLEEKLQQVALTNENLAWQGSTTHGTGNNALLDGLVHQLVYTSCSASTVATSGFTGVTSANVIALFDHMVNIAPDAIRTQNDLVLFCGLDVFMLYVQALRNANLFFYDVTGDNQNFKLRIPGSPVTVIGTPGLSGTNPLTSKKNLILTSGQNIYLGTDLYDETQAADLWYSRDFREIRLAIQYKLGYVFGFCDFVVFHNT